MNLLQVFFIISWIIISILALDIAKRQKFNALHFFVFILVWLWLLLFTFFPSILNWIWNIFGLQRWADVLVYASIIFLVYFVLLLLRKVEWNVFELTLLVREIAIQNSPKKIINWKFIILMRAYNEWSVIKDTINSVIDNGFDNILVVNDWSTDNTDLELGSIKKWNLIILKHFRNRWGWAALETGFEYIRRYWKVDYIITFDADGQHDVCDLKKVDNYLKEHKKVDVFIGSRFLSKRQIWMPLSRRIILKLGIVFTFLLSRVNLSDSHNGFRIFRREVLDKINLTIDGMWYASEMIDIIATKEIPFKEIPVNIIYTEYSLWKWQKNSNALNIAFKMIWNKFFK